MRNKLMKLKWEGLNLGDGSFWGGSLPLPASWSSASSAFKTDISNSILPYNKSEVDDKNIV